MFYFTSSSTTSHKPSVAIIKYLVLGVIINYSTWGSTEHPSDFKLISPNALVTAKDPPTLLLKITPPSFLILYNIYIIN